MTAWLLVHSAFLGPASWSPVAEELAARGDTAAVPDLRAHAASAAAAARAAALAAGDTAVAVAVHSAAGTLVPELAVALGERFRGAVFVDAAVPEPGQSWEQRAPAEMVALLRRRGTETHVGPWDTWWHGATLEALLPGAQARARVLGECLAVPWSLLREPVTADRTWLRRPLAYLQLSDAYEAEAATAESLGWPVVRLAAHHLATVTDAGAVADVLAALA